MFAAPTSAISACSLRRVHVALERMPILRIAARVDRRGRPPSAPECSTLARVVSKWVLFGTYLPCPPTSSKRMRSLARPWCVGRMCGMPVRSLHDLLEAEPALGAGVGLVAAEHAGPLLAAHGRRAAVGEQVDEHVFGGDEEGVEVGRRRIRSRSSGVVIRIGSTILMRNGSMMVFMARSL